jgi:hypothetical protein
MQGGTGKTNRIDHGMAARGRSMFGDVSSPPGAMNDRRVMYDGCRDTKEMRKKYERSRSE